MSEHDPHGSPSPSTTHGQDGYSNPEVRYERSDIEIGGVVTFVVVLAVVILLSGALLAGLFGLYQGEAVRANDLDSLPLAKTDRNQLPVAPRLEGIEPNEHVERAWPGAFQAGGPTPWFGYNVRVVPAQSGGSDVNESEERDRLAALAMGQKLQRVNATLAELAGKLPSQPRATSLPPDVFRRSAGDSNAGRSAEGKAP
jgi:hypothetical protein